MASNKSGIVAWVLAAACALVGGLATFLPTGNVQVGADKAAQMCEANGFTAYPREPDGSVTPRPDAAEARTVGLVPAGTGYAPVLLPAAKASSTVEDVGPAQ